MSAREIYAAGYVQYEMPDATQAANGYGMTWQNGQLVFEPTSQQVQGTAGEITATAVGQGDVQIALANPLTVPGDLDVTNGHIITSTTGSNVRLGQGSLASATTGSYVVAVGQAAAADLTTATDVVAIGPFSANKLTTSTYVVAVGSYAASEMTAGGAAVVVGKNACLAATNITDSVCVGSQIASAAASVAESVLVGDVSATGAVTDCIAIGTGLNLGANPQHQTIFGSPNMEFYTFQGTNPVVISSIGGTQPWHPASFTTSAELTIGAVTVPNMSIFISSDGFVAQCWAKLDANLQVGAAGLTTATLSNFGQVVAAEFQPAGGQTTSLNTIAWVNSDAAANSVITNTTVNGAVTAITFTIYNNATFTNGERYGAGAFQYLGAWRLQ